MEQTKTIKIIEVHMAWWLAKYLPQLDGCEHPEHERERERAEEATSCLPTTSEWKETWGHQRVRAGHVGVEEESPGSPHGGQPKEIRTSIIIRENKTY